MKKKETIGKKSGKVIVRKNIDLDTEVLARLEEMAKNDNRKLKPYVELVLINHSKAEA